MRVWSQIPAMTTMKNSPAVSIRFSGESTDTPKLGPKFDEALIYARTLHHTQTRKGTDIPYMAHLMSVAAIALEHGADEDEAIAALLHDAVEDQGGAKTLLEIRRRFGDKVAGIVETCSDAEGNVGQTKPPWRERKLAYIRHLHTASEPALLVSASDKLHNARAILHDFREQGDALFDRFNAGKQDVLWYYRELVRGFENARNGSDRLRPLVQKLTRVVDNLHQEALG